MGKIIRYISLFLISIILGLTVSRYLSLPKEKEKTNPIYQFQVKETKEKIGKITIPKIDLEEYLYEIDSEENTIEKNITILKESSFPSILFLAAHSGEGKIAYFEQLDQLEINDEINLIMYQEKYTYIVKDIWEEKKTGYIHLNKEIENQLVLTTCSPQKKNYQLIINCIEKESH